MKKQTKVLLAASLFTLGASFSSMAALKNGTWMVEDGQYVYYDREGELVTEEWCESLGKEYWMNEEGYLGSCEWVSEGEYSYYVQSDGSKTIDAWKYIYGEDDEDADEESWFYFDAKGRMLENTTKKINGQWYFFGTDGKMLTGWVEKRLVTDENGKAILDSNGDKQYLYLEAENKNTSAANIYYCNEDGSRASKMWLEDFGWGEDADELYDEDLDWYYIKSNGQVQKGMNKDIDGLTYIFGTNGKMLTGWVGCDDSDEDNIYYEVTEDALSEDDYSAVYYCTEVGYAKKSTWAKLEDPTEDDEFWFYFDKNGKVFAPEVASDAKVVTFVNGDYNKFTDSDAIEYTTKKIDGTTYLFDTDGKMLSGLLEIDGNVYYYGTEDEGAMVIGKTVVADADDYTFEFAFGKKTENGYVKGAAVTGNFDGYCYKKGQLMTSGEAGAYKVIETANGDFVVNNAGKIQHRDGKKYEMADGTTKTFTFEASAKGAYEDAMIEVTSSTVTE